MFDDRIVVESPGKLPGLVKTENIRTTHFSRNPKIAEFLKVFKYVKEYGEGVNRMFEEMNTVGLPEPEFCRNNFMLQTVIRNKSETSNRALPIVDLKLPIQAKKLPIQAGKLPIGQLEERLKGKDVSHPIHQSIVQFFREIELNQVFGRREVEKIVNCSYRNAGNLISVMKVIGIIEAVPGKGKGKYIIKPFI